MLKKTNTQDGKKSLSLFSHIIIGGKNKILYLIVFIILILGVTIVFHDYKWYGTPIVRIESAQNKLDNQTQDSSAGEKYYDQKLTGTVMNGEYKGQEISMQNKYSSSGVYDEQYKPGDEVFAEITANAGGGLTGAISGLKRDKYMALLSALIIMLIFLAANKKGLLSILSLSANIAIFYYALELYSQGRNILVLSNGLVLFFTFVSLLFIGGFKKKTFVAILSTLIALGFTMLLFKIVMNYTSGVDYAFMEYIATPSDLPEIFMSQILIGGLGAIMDVAITEASTINELTTQNAEISVKDLLKSGREVGYDIMGTMINVMLFTYLCGSIPLIILQMKSDVRLHTIILWHMPMEIYRFLAGSIGIVLSIPISLLVSIVLFKKSWRFL